MAIINTVTGRMSVKKPNTSNAPSSDVGTGDFSTFARIVNSTFQKLVANNPFVVDIEGDFLFQAYLNAFPEGTNPVFRERTEHDCSCCKSFIKHVGHVVNITDKGELLTVWDDAAESSLHPYNLVAAALRDRVRSSTVSNLFRTTLKEFSFGAEQSRSMGDDGKVMTWRHFFSGPVPLALRSATADTVRGDYRTTRDVFMRGLSELKPDAITTVLSLIDAEGDAKLYRGAEHRKAVVEFQKAQTTFLALTPQQQSTFAWVNATGPASRFRNTVIGTLASELSDGMDIEKAVGRFESMVAPQNYKRTSSIVTPGMVKTAMKTIEELDLESALERRFARIGDVSVRDVLWVDSNVRPQMKGGLGDMLMQHAKAAQSLTVDEEKAEKITIEAFIKDILPETTGMELFFKSEHIGNLMSLTAPVHPEPKSLFRWDNDFAWTYNGNVADSIKERVKKAGGNVTNANLRVSLSWSDYDDLDIHVTEPDGTQINFRTRVSPRTRASLDVDMNAGHGNSRTPVENISWPGMVPDGAYKVVVNNFAHRENPGAGFTVEIESGGKLHHFSATKPGTGKDVNVATLHIKRGIIEKIEPGKNVASSSVSQEKWGLNTEKFVKVSAVTLSPNFWGENAVGNKHTFFVLDGAHNDEPARGIYNEYLHPRLEQHRKVFDVIADKTKCQPTEGQLSGVGFSSTKSDSVLVKVTQGKKQRLFNVQINA